MDYTMDELMEYNQRIEDIAKEIGLDYFDQEFEIVSFEDMLCYEAYLGMPSHYPHWSYGKNYEKLKVLYQHNIVGLPYEMVINSNPCLAYLMKDNTLLLQILTIAHVYGHNDFFKNNRLFKEYTKPELTVEMFKNHANRIRNYIQDPGIGYHEVEKILDAAHSIRYHCGLFCSPSEDVVDKIEYPYENLLGFLSIYGELSNWQKDVLMIVLEESRYFIPQIETKIINEGWATFWHYQILNRLKLDQGKHIEFLKVHNNIVSQMPGGINPYYLGFKIWESLYHRYDGDFKMLSSIRSLERDASFIRKYLTVDLCQEANLIEFQEEEKYYLVSEVSSDDGWKKIRNTLAESVGMGTTPRIYVEEVRKSDHTLILQHIYDGREIHLTYATETLKHIQTLWGGKVILRTTLTNIPRKIFCDENKKVSIQND